jgi:hypothetical protein
MVLKTQKYCVQKLRTDKSEHKQALNRTGGRMWPDGITPVAGLVSFVVILLSFFRNPQQFYLG